MDFILLEYKSGFPQEQYSTQCDEWTTAIMVTYWEKFTGESFTEFPKDTKSLHDWVGTWTQDG